MLMKIRLLFFNNDSDGTNTFSSVHIVAPNLDENNKYIVDEKNKMIRLGE